MSYEDLSRGDLSRGDLTSFRPPPNLTRDTSDSGYTDTGYSSRGSSINPPSRQSSYTAPGSSDKFFDDLNDETPMSPIVEGDESVTPKVAAQGLAGPEESTKAQQNIYQLHHIILY